MIHQLRRFLVVACLVGGLAAGTPAIAACGHQSGPSLVSLFNAVIADDEDHHRGGGEAHASISGIVDSVDYASNSIEVLSGAGKMKVVITPTTAIALRGQVGGIADLRHGVRVTVSGIVQNGVMRALSIIIK
jgi:hypothetical protein